MFLVEHLSRRGRLFACSPYCAMSLMLGLVIVGWRHSGDAIAGMAAATFYLMLPYTGLYIG